MRAWLLAFQPKTLTAALVPVLVGTALAYSDFGSFDFMVLGLTLLASFSIQIATNLFNDVIDFKKGADNEDRMGPIRVTQKGLITSQRVTLIASLFLLLAFLNIPKNKEGIDEGNKVQSVRIMKKKYTIIS